MKISIPLSQSRKSTSSKIPQPNFVELNPDDVYSAMLKCIAGFKKYHNQIEAIAYDTFSPSVAFMDKEGNALYPFITHLDRRSGEQSEKIQQEMGSNEFQSITGTFPFTGGASITSCSGSNRICRKSTTKPTK